NTSASRPWPAAAIRSACPSPRAVSIWASRPIPAGSNPAAADTSSGDSTLGSTTTSGRASAAARRSSSHHGVDRPLMRSAVVRPSGPCSRAATASPRASSLSSAATASSRSTITSSAASDAAFASIRSLEAGTVRQERRGRSGTARTLTLSRGRGTTTLPRRMAPPSFRTRPLERERPAHLERVPALRKIVELLLELRWKRLRAPALLELPGELLRAASIREARPAHALLAPHLGRQLRVERLEDPRVAAGGEIAEDGAVQSELGLGDEVKEVVREPGVVADRPAPAIGIAVAVHFDRVLALALLDERDLPVSDLRTKNWYWRRS